MLKATVNKYLGRTVEVVLFDKSSYQGVLTSTNNIPYRMSGSYFCEGLYTNYEFKSSHIRKIKEI